MAIEVRTVASTADRGSRANRPGSRWVYPAAVAGAILAAVVLALAVTGTFSLGRAGNAQVGSHYGQIPSWETIPEPTQVKNPTASAANPDTKAMEGYPVDATLAAGSVTLNAEGPILPAWVQTQVGEGTYASGQAVPSDFDMSFTAAKGAVPLNAGQFTVITYQGQLLHPKATLVGGGALPSHVAAGQTVKVQLSTQVPEGDGEVRWSANDQDIMVAYFWTLELN